MSLKNSQTPQLLILKFPKSNCIVFRAGNEHIVLICIDAKNNVVMAPTLLNDGASA